jgi:hypothetical protein
MTFFTEFTRQSTKKGTCLQRCLSSGPHIVDRNHGAKFVILVCHFFIFDHFHCWELPSPFVLGIVILWR